VAQAQTARDHEYEHARRRACEAHDPRVQPRRGVGARERIGTPVQRERAEQRGPDQPAHEDHRRPPRYAREALERHHGGAEEQQRHRVDPERDREDQRERDGAARGGQDGPCTREQLVHAPSPSIGRM
jgi:hypothetical protein